jgi:hypothetical protein
VIVRVVFSTVYFQSTAFGLPSNFGWLYKYSMNKVGDGNSTVLDMFDPLAASDQMNGSLIPYMFFKVFLLINND